MFLLSLDNLTDEGLLAIMVHLKEKRFKTNIYKKDYEGVVRFEANRIHNEKKRVFVGLAEALRFTID